MWHHHYFFLFFIVIIILSLFGSLLSSLKKTTINNDICQITVFIYMKKLFCQQNELICSDNMCYYCIVDHMFREREINSSFANLWEPNHRPVAEFIIMRECKTVHTKAISHKKLNFQTLETDRMDPLTWNWGEQLLTVLGLILYILITKDLDTFWQVEPWCFLLKHMNMNYSYFFLLLPLFKN